MTPDTFNLYDTWPDRPKRPLMSSEEIDRLFSKVSVSPIHHSTHYDHIGENRLGVHFDHPKAMERMVQASGVPIQRLTNTATQERFPRIRVEFDAASRERIGQFGLVHGTAGDLSKNYYLEILEDGRMFVKYQKIIGSREIGRATPDQIDRVINMAAVRIAERDQSFEARHSAPADSVKPNANKLHIDSLLSDIHGALGAGQSGSEPETKAMKARAAVTTAVSAQKADSNPILAELALLSQDGQTIVLPDVQLAHYAEIKKLMLRAGGEYASNGRGSYFIFPEGIDPGIVLMDLKQGRALHVKKEKQFFGTSPALADEACAKLGDLRGCRVLEPSAGEGALADAARAAGASEVVTVENWAVNIAALKAKGYAPLECDFLGLKPEDTGLFDAVLMNPPFSNRQDIAHVRHALSFLKAEGELVSIMSPGFRTSKVEDGKNFAGLVQLAEAEVQDIDAGAFKAAGTAVKTVMVRFSMTRLVAALDEQERSASEFKIALSPDTLQASRMNTSMFRP